MRNLLGLLGHILFGLRFRLLLDWLRDLAEQRLGVRDATPAEVPVPIPLMSE